MTISTKAILDKALVDFDKADKSRKLKLIYQFQRNVKYHKRLYNNMELGYTDSVVKAGEIFLRIHRDFIQKNTNPNVKNSTL